MSGGIASFTWPPYQQLGYFVSSVDVFAPAQSPPIGEVTVTLQNRGRGPVQTITFPNFEATTDNVAVVVASAMESSRYDPPAVPVQNLVALGRIDEAYSLLKDDRAIRGLRDVDSRIPR